MITVRLTPDEMKLCWEKANERHQSARKHGAVCTLELKAKENPIDQDYIGIFAEVAYCKAYGLPTSLVFDDQRDDLEELQLGDIKHNGIWVDLKSSRHKNARLIYPVQKKHRCKAQYLCLVVVYNDTATIKGFSKSSEFMRDENIGTLAGSRPLYILDQDQLEKEPSFINPHQPKKGRETGFNSCIVDNRFSLDFFDRF